MRRPRRRGRPPGCRWRSSSSVAWHSNGRDLAISLSDARSPYDVYSIDVPGGRVDRWTESETGGIAASEFAAPELIRFKSFDGREITGFLYKPPARFAGPRPLLDQHPRRSRGAGASGLPGTLQLLRRRAGCRDHLSQRAGLRRLREVVPQARQRRRSARTRSRTSGRFSTGSRRGPTSTRRG